MKTAEAIPTLYKGLSFRARTEARWAAFFDRLHVTWEYEPRGYTAGGGAYMPDFYLPELHCWLETKGDRPGGHEKQKLIQLAKHTVCAGYIQQGAPGDAWGMLVATRAGFPHNLTWWSAHPAQLADGRIGFAVECEEEADPVLMAGAHELPVLPLAAGAPLSLTLEVLDAIQLARSTKWVETPGPKPLARERWQPWRERRRRKS